MTPAIDEGKLNQLVGQILNDLGGAASVAMVRMGDALGLYKTLHEKGSMTSEELAKAAGAHERYVREWLAHQAASNYLTYDQTNGKFTLPPEQAMLFAIEDSPVTMLGAFDGVAAWAEGQPKVQAAFRHGGGVNLDFSNAADIYSVNEAVSGCFQHAKAATRAYGGIFHLSRAMRVRRLCLSRHAGGRRHVSWLGRRCPGCLTWAAPTQS